MVKAVEKKYQEFLKDQQRQYDGFRTICIIAGAVTFSVAFLVLAAEGKRDVKQGLIAVIWVALAIVSYAHYRNSKSSK